MKLVAFAFSRGRSGYLSVIFVLTLAFSALMIGACGSDDPSVTFPTPAPVEQNDWLYSVAGFAADDVYACGAKGAMFHYDGTSWTLVSMGTANAIVQMWNDGSGSIYACGHGGKLWINSGGGWSSLDSGTTQNLYGVGSFAGSIYACGERGTLRRRASGSWSGVGGTIIKRDPTSGAPEDTLAVGEDIASLVTVNEYGFGGAYDIPDYDEDTTGVLGTAGMMLAQDDEGEYDWLLRPIKGGQQDDPEWVLCSVSSSDVVGDNYLGTSWGWLFRLEEAEGDRLVWSIVWPQVVDEPATGLRSIWRDANSNLYMATDDGQIVYQTFDFEYGLTGERTVLFDGLSPLMGIWGADPQNLYVVGYMEGTLLMCSHDQITGDFTFEIAPVDFPDKGMGLAPGVDQIGLPLR